MKLNTKGFTMIELLTAISLIAILSGIAIAAVSRYREQTSYKAYKFMEKSAYDAAQNYILDKGIIISDTKELNVDVLIEAGYLDKLEDPRDKGNYCHTGSTVEVKKISTGITDPTILKKYEYTVKIVCKQYKSQSVECVPNGTLCTRDCSNAENQSTCENLSSEQKMSSCASGNKMCIVDGVKFES